MKFGTPALVGKTMKNEDLGLRVKKYNIKKTKQI